MPDKILLKRSLTSGSIPTTASLSVGELAVNVPDGKLYLRQSGSGTDTIRSLLTLDTPMSGNLLLTGSIVSIQGITGSLLGTSSWANNSISSSFTITASAATSITFTSFSNASYYFPQNLRVEGTLTAQQFNTEIVSSSIIYESGSTKFGDSLDDTHQFTGSVQVSGSITGSLFGTSSWSFNSISSSFATTASAATSITFTPSTASFANTASFAPVGPGTTNRIALFNSTNTISSSVIAQSGETIGIGTTTTVEKVTISSGSILLDNNYAIRMRDTANTVESVLGITTANNIQIASPTLGGSVQYFVRNNSGVHQFHTNGAEVVRISNSGNMGVGTPSPAARLHVSASGTINDLLVGDTTTPKLFVSASGDVAIGTTSTGARLRVIGSGSNAAGAYIGAGTDNYFDAQNTVFRLSNQSETMRINSSGNVGISTTSPAARLHISASGTVNDLLIGDTTTPKLFVSASGNVGIGDSAPSDKLVINGRTRISGNNVLAFGDSPGGQAWIGIASALVGTLTFRTYDGSSFVERMRIVNTTGNVGINTAAPSASLHVSASGTTNDLLVGDTITPKLFVSASGNVGIGTTSPSVKLQVSGSQIIDGGLTVLESGSSIYPLTVGYSTRPTTTYIRVNASSSTFRGYEIQTGGTRRWLMYADNNPDTGADAGSAFAIGAYTDAGTFIDNPIQIIRAAGSNMFLNRPLRVITGSNAVPVINPAAGYGITFPTATNIGFVINSSEAMRVDSSANVGIGTTSAGAKLHVQGNVSASSYTSSINNAVGFFGTASWAASASVATGFAGTANRVLYNNASNVTTTSANLTFDGTNLTVGGQLNAATKSFLINHKTKPGKKLVYGVIEGPEHSVFIRGRLTGKNTIVLPNEWEWLVDLDSITVQLTAIGKPQKLFVKSIDRLYITVENGVFLSGPIDCYYFIQATRKDVDPLQTVV